MGKNMSRFKMKSVNKRYITIEADMPQTALINKIQAI